MNILGLSAGFHDAAVSVIDYEGNILFAAHNERYSKLKNDASVSGSLLYAAKQFGEIDCVAYYENPLQKQLRNFYNGQGFNFNQTNLKNVLHTHLCHLNWPAIKKYKKYNHHLSHAAAGFQTSPFDRATVVVIDAIGEWDTISIWAAEYKNQIAYYKKLWSQKYPHSLGLFYSAFTHRVGLKPMDEEYILMGMSAYGDPQYADILSNELIANECDIRFKQNLHLGLNDNQFKTLSNEDLAASAQNVLENLICNVMFRAKSYKWSDNLVYMGGVALNCLANRNLGMYFNNIWIMPNPGDAGSSLGAAALALGKKLNWQNAYLGENIPGEYPVNKILDVLLQDKIAGVASGRAEFGPRALGNRSLLADPRGHDIKDKVNEIKKRQKFRPFAPVILEECADDYFILPSGWKQSRYMQVVSQCRYPDQFPAIVHVDESSRVQTVPKDNSGIRQLLEKWFVLTGCPMLLNTSLNIKGQPIVNDRHDADQFEKLYGVKVLS